MTNVCPRHHPHRGDHPAAIGFGTYRLKGSVGVASIANSIKAGYRLLDSAFNYENDGALGEAIRRVGIPREECA